MHVQPRQRAPRPANQIEGEITPNILPPRLGEHLADLTIKRATSLGPDRGQAQDAERQRNPVTHLAAFHTNQFEATSAKVADNTVGIRNSRNHAKAGCSRFFDPSEDFHVDAQLRRSGSECRTIACVADSGRRHGADAGNAHGVGQSMEARQSA